MDGLVECVPNVSEGRDSRKLSKLLSRLEGFSDVAVLDLHRDVDHHRSVFTIVGPPSTMQEALFAFVEESQQMLDIRQHQGEHPRIGIVDVVPFIPLPGVSQQECLRLCHRLGNRIGRELHIPVFLYGEASPHSERAGLEAIRQGGVRTLGTKMQSNSLWKPDFGPDHIHPESGALALGVRFFLVAFNVVLATHDMLVAKNIARTVRSSGGGLPELKAMGVNLHSRGVVQVSMNLTDFRVTSLKTAYRAVEKEANRYGVTILESEVVGLVPQAAWEEGLANDLKVRNWDFEKILENRL